MAPENTPGMKNNGMGAWMIKLLALIPYVVSGIEQIHSDAKSGAEKKQLAMEALGLASAGASAVSPSNDPAIQAATLLASATIDGVKTVYNAAKKKTALVAAPARAADPEPDPAPENL